MREQICQALSSLASARDRMEGYVDVSDGDYGMPGPNKAMRAVGDLDEAIDVLEKMLKALDVKAVA